MRETHNLQLVFPQGILREFPIVFGHLTFFQPIKSCQFLWYSNSSSFFQFTTVQHTNEPLYFFPIHPIHPIRMVFSNLLNMFTPIFGVSVS